MVRPLRHVAWMVLGLLFTMPVLAQQPGAADKTASVHVILPQANATLTIQGQATRQGGAERDFVSPPLDGGDYVYTLVAKWEPNNYTKITRTRSVNVRAGSNVTVDMRQADDSKPDDIVIRYVPTPMEVVEAMLKLGEVAKDEVVYDLGCGDGRIVVTAVEKYGAKRGIGMDIDPERIKDSKVTAQKAKVEDKVEFQQQDVLKIKDFSDANVVMLYMGNDLNVAIKPVLRSTLKPGSRIVSHRFTMGDWEPEKTITVHDKTGQEYKIHLWRIGEKK